MTDGTKARVDRRLVLRFFDEAPEDSLGHATSVVSVAGEEFGRQLLFHYFRSQGVDAHLVSARCTTGKVKGPRLDAWIEAGDVLYQTEIKNSSAHAFHGKRLELDAPPDVATAYRMASWLDVWDGAGFRDKRRMGKVLTRMKPPVEHAQVEPLIAFWIPMHPTGGSEPFFRVPVEGTDFESVNVFSMSNYLRNCTSDVIELDMPEARARTRWLERLFVFS